MLRKIIGAILTFPLATLLFISMDYHNGDNIRTAISTGSLFALLLYFFMFGLYLLMNGDNK